MKPIYKIGIELSDDELCFDFNAIVDAPAHMRSFDAFGKEKIQMYFADDEKMRITGVMISEGTPIYRNDAQLGEHYVVFQKDEIEKLWIRFNEFGFTNNLNKQHDSNQVINNKDMFMIEQWIVDYENGKGVPVSLSKQGIRTGSLMATYQIRSVELWNEIKSGKYNGFSIEGVFLKSPLKVAKSDGFKKLSKDDLILRNIYFHLQKKQND